MSGASAHPPLVVWRIAARRYRQALFSGEGTLRHGGRWLPPGCRVIYCAENLALALLEYRVNYPLPDMPPLVAASLTLPGTLKIQAPSVAKLPRGWFHPEQPAACRELGAQWWREGKSAVLKLPSAIVRREYNYLINTEHPDFARCKIGPIETLPADPRLKLAPRRRPTKPATGK